MARSQGWGRRSQAPHGSGRENMVHMVVRHNIGQDGEDILFLHRERIWISHLERKVGDWLLRLG